MYLGVSIGQYPMLDPAEAHGNEDKIAIGLDILLI